MFRSNVGDAGVGLKADQSVPVCLAGIERLHGLVGVGEDREFVTSDQEND
jgi:hypothetical protein